VTYPASDGVRYIVLNRKPGVVRILDTEAGKARDVAVSERCGVRDAIAGIALVACDGDTLPYLLRLETGTIVISGTGAGPPGTHWGGIGRHWFVGYADRGRESSIYRNRETGETHELDTFTSPPYDLDVPAFTPYSDSHYVFDRDGASVMKDLLGAHKPHHPLVIDNPHTRVVLSSCPTLCSLGSLSAGLATWREANSVRAYDTRSGRRLRWKIAYPGYTGPAQVLHTRTRVLVALTQTEAPYGPKLLWARVRH
jgi:hypothetical protein